MAQPESDFGARGLENVLAHHGIKGMKWGVRRSEAQLARASARSNDAVKVGELTTKAKTSGKASLTNEELQTVITRKNLEQQFSKLNPTTVQRGLSVIQQLTTGVQTVNNFTNVTKTAVKNIKK